MNQEIANLVPQSVWRHFAAICDVPRPSKKEEKIILIYIPPLMKLVQESNGHTFATQRDSKVCP